MAKAFSVSTGVQGAEIWLNYLESNQRITTVEWTLPASVIRARVVIWNNGTLFYDRTYTGPSSGTESIAGNHKAVLNEFGYYSTPRYITYAITFETVGG